MLNEDSLERELSCGICFELYNEPLQLPCMHTFCKDCIKDVLANSRNKKLKCPDCRRPADLGKNGIESLKRNFKLASIVDVYRQALEKLALSSKEARNSQQVAAASSDAEEKDYEFLSNVIKSSFDDSSPFEPHIIDDLWGTFKRTAKRGSYSERPPAPPPPRAPAASRPLPPIPPSERRSRDLSQPTRPLPPEPPTDDSDETQRNSSVITQDTRSSPPSPSNEDRLEPSAPPYFTLSEAHSGDASLSVDEDIMSDLASMSAPPLPPRVSYPPPSKTTTRSMDNRPPIPAPRGNKGAPPLPRRDNMPNTKATEGPLQDGRRPPPPVPRSLHSS